MSSGPDGGGTSVILTGANFYAVSQVKFGSVVVSNFVVNSSTQLTAQAPVEAAGTINVTVTTPVGTSATSSANQFTFTSLAVPTVTSVTVNTGPTAGGSEVDVNGTHFTGATAVYFGSTAATSFSIVSDGSLFAVAPAGSAGTVNITVVDSDGTSATSSNDDYTYVAAPTLSSVSPNTDTASGGTPIVLTGTNLSGAYAVYFGTAAASYVVNSSTQITAVSPAESTGTVNITVITSGGASNGETFTYTTATTATWIGGTTGSFGTASNWSTGVVPGSGTDVVIPSGDTVTYSSRSTLTFHSLQVAGTLVESSMSNMAVTSNSSIANFNQQGAGITIGGTLTITGTYSWTGVTVNNNLAGTGTLLIASTATFAISSTIIPSLGVSVDNQGTTTLSATSGTPGLALGTNVTFLNDTTGTFTDQTTVNDTISGTSALFENLGTFTKAGSGGSAGTTTFSTSFTNSGTVAINRGTLILSGGGSNSGTITTASGTNLTLSSTTFNLSSGSSISGSGTVTFGSGTTTVAGTLSAGSFSISSGATVSGAATFTGNLTNNGTLNVGGTGAAGKVTITGNYTQGSSGALDIELGGLTAGTQYDQLAISGTATLAGTLNLRLINGFAPSSGNSFQIMTFTSETGTFGTVNGETQGARTLTPAYNSGNVTINVTMAEPVQAEDDLREEVVPDEALALLWHEPNQGQMSFLEMRVPMGAFGMLDENEFDALLGVGNEGDRQVRRIG